ncbi:Protein phosphatase inhibitor 2 (IPP-2) [Popillia japonica]|uniref:Protein phosphatase inhibitor 2 (IPP-2) n=1 Tax=Popillia japonica TaxID=7064 RepID=A0AAW1JX29_POPJA
MKPILKKSEKKKVVIRPKRKSAKFDEVNIAATLHPTDKDYGHMKIDEPKTPYSYDDDAHTVDAAEVTRKLLQGGSAKVLTEARTSDSKEELVQKKKEDFEKRRKQHYDEYKRAKMASEALQDDDDDELDEFLPSSSH